MTKEMRLTADERNTFGQTLELRFNQFIHRHPNQSWEQVETRLNKYPDKLSSLFQMEETGGEPDVIGQDSTTGEIIFCDCSPESPSGRRSVCYDREGWESRKEHRPVNTAMDMAAEMGIRLLTPEEYIDIQKLGPFDTKTSSWLMTPEDLRIKGGALFGDFRYGRAFVYHNGAQSYYAVRGFRGILKV